MKDNKLYTINKVSSADGTVIGYRKIGNGPGLILLHGAFESSQSHTELAELLADKFTVYLPDRRGRGLSGPYAADHHVKQDVEDMDALLQKTGAHYVFGISSGGIIWLEAALSLTAIHKAVIYEPPFYTPETMPDNELKRYEQELADGDIKGALVTGMLAAQMGPKLFRLLPRWLLKTITGMIMKAEGKNAKTGDATMANLAPTLRYDFLIVKELAGHLPRFSKIKAEILLMGGSTSPAYLKKALDLMQEVLPGAKRIELKGLGHGGSGNANRGGKPDVVAKELKQFFS